MFWNKKEDKKALPDLPPMKPFSKPEWEGKEEDNEDVIEKHALPSFPDSPIKKGFSQTAIKEAVDSKKEELPKITEVSRIPKIQELEEPPTPEEEDKEPVPFVRTEKSPQDIFVKIDKFHSARKSLKSARDKLQEIENLLRKIRETKMREEQEITTWEEDLTSIKSKVEDVTKNIFEKVE